MSSKDAEPSGKGGAPAKRISEARESRLVVEYAFDMAERLAIGHILVRADLLQDRRIVERHRAKKKLIWLVQAEHMPDKTETSPKDTFIRIPRGTAGRIGQVTIGLTAAVLLKKLKVEESVICLTGMAGSKRLDNLLVINPRRDLPWFRGRKLTEASSRIASEEGLRLIEIALKFAAEGREGKPVGTMFVLGRPRALSNYTRALILNPMKGHSPEVRSIHNPDFVETLRELAAIDGAFIVDTRGVVTHAGVYLDAPVTKRVEVREGLGTRHVAGAAISTRANAVAVVISESSGRVTVYSGGAPVLELEGRP
jgi:DNA integrity scanning protein DisA with diadenylate cyclase activity